MYIRLHVKHPFFMSDFNETSIFSADFRKLFKYQISYKKNFRSRVIPCGWTDGQTHMTKLIVTFRNISNAPKIGTSNQQM